MKHLISTIFLLLALLLPATANAYDFEVDGIYYNKTSANTVEVTYETFDVTGGHFSVYSGNVDIPSFITIDNIGYQVTAIGDSAFCCTDCTYQTRLHSVTIPESVTNIGKDAFAGCIGLCDVTCLALTPPSNEGNFVIKEYCGSIYGVQPNTNFFETHNIDTRPWAILHVPLEAYEAYKESSQWTDDFNFIVPIGAEKTAPPTITTEIFAHDGKLCFGEIHADDGCQIYWSRDMRVTYKSLYSGGTYYYYDWGLCPGYHYNSYFGDYGDHLWLNTSAFAIEDGKEPSDFVSTGSIRYAINMGVQNGYNILLYSEKLSDFIRPLYDFEVDRVCYSIIDDSSVEVVRDVNKCGSIRNQYYFDQTFYNDTSNVSFKRNGFYDGGVIIPSTVNYNGRTYTVTNISRKAFIDDWYHNQLYENTMGQCAYHLGYIDYAYNGDVLGCNLRSISIPVSITSIADSTFNRSLESVYISGEGEWQAGALPETVKTLYLGSGVTGVKGIQVNPEVIYSYATTPPICDENSFTGYGAELHVPASSLAAYFTAPYWCNFTNIIGDAVAMTDLTINRDSVEMLMGEQITLHATVSPAGAIPNDISWCSTDQSVATVENGVITAIKGGECDIVATCQDKQAICHVVVTEILPTEVTLNQDEAKIEIGSQLNLTATVQPENTSNPTVTWRTTNSAVATVSNGVVTGVGQGECNIIASCGDRQAICHVIVVEHLIYITLDQHSASLLPNHIITLTPTVAPVATDLVVTSSNPAVAAARLAGNKIQVVGITEGHATIYVNSADGYAFSDSCLVEVYTERGDVNCDGFVNISDVTALIDVLLGGDVNHSEENADCNNDGKMTISDVTALIDALLGGAPLPEKNYEVITVNGVTFKMIKVQGGTFTMGATPDHGTEDPWNDEWPTHEVTVSSFSIGQTEVTQELWQAVMGSNPSYFTGDASRPVETVSWDECQQFIATLNQLTGMNFRMPTEAEWEYAARGGNMTGGYKYAGSNDINEIAWWDDNACDGVGENSPDYGTHPVALKKANELGLYDMSGNVWEWCQDWYGPYSEEAQINPTGPETGTDHLHRGGSWINYARNCRVSCRFHWVSDGANYVGLRLVK